MVRNFPMRQSSPHNNPLLSVTFVVAFIAAVVTIVSSLCGFTKKKQQTPTRRQPLVGDQETQTLHVRIKKNRTDNAAPSLDPPPSREANIELLPPPPKMAKLRAASYHVRSSSNASEKGKLSTSMSMRSIGGHKKASTTKKESKHVKNSLSHEDSIWKKTIILGEKCRVPDDEEEAIVYDEKGMRIPTFHRKQSSVGLQISRQNSTLESTRENA